VLLTLVIDDRRHGTHVPARRIVGAGVALAGIAVLASASVGTVTPLGVGLLVATGVAWGLYTAAGRGAADPLTATTGHFTLLAGVLLLPAGAGLATGLHASAEGVGWAVVMGAGSTGFAYVAWYTCQRTLTGTQAGLVQLVIPVLTTVGAVALLAEALSARLILAAALVGAGMFLGRAGPTGQADRAVST
jgi:drug/metabolite transporter (DMT)-like permease